MEIKIEEDNIHSWEDWCKHMNVIPKDQYEALKQHLFELSYSIDSHSSSKDYAALRNTHYENQNWIKENGLQDEYYNYFFKQIKEIKDALC